MALTPEDVLKKSFGATQFRRGYDEREVDDFLDEVVNELRELTAERDDYKRKYEESVKRGGGAVVTKVDDERVAAQVKQIEELKRELAEAKSRTAAVPAKAAAAPARDDSVRVSAELEQVRADLAAKEAELARVRTELEQTRATPGDEASKAAGVLAMAQQLHDQLVAKGEAERDRLVGEGSTERDRLLAEAQQRHKALITEATTQHETLLADANAKRQQVLSGLEEQRTGLEREIAGLRAFESKYKQQLVGFLEGKLHEAKNTGSLEPRD